MCIDGTHERMRTYEDAAAQIVMPAGFEWVTPKNDPFLVRSKLLIPTAESAMKVYGMGTAYANSIESDLSVY